MVFIFPIAPFAKNEKTEDLIKKTINQEMLIVDGGYDVLCKDSYQEDAFFFCVYSACKKKDYV